MNKDTLKRYEGKLTKLFINSRIENRLFNAYLLYGPKNAPLKDIALYLCQSLNCENDLLACNECDSCKRFLQGSRPDFLLIDGRNSVIKKGDVKELEEKFAHTSIEKNHIPSYVILNVENMNNEASNALLKFLEEPKSGQIAFLTTNNLDKVLPTIKSRSLAIQVDPCDTSSFYNELVEHTFINEKGKEIHLSVVESFILSTNYATIEEVEQLLKEDSSILNCISAGEQFVNDYITNYKTSTFTLLKLTNQLKDSEYFYMIFSTINYIFESALIYDQDDNNPFIDLYTKLNSKKKYITQGMDVIKDVLTHKNLNYNPFLISARFLYSLKEED